MYFLLLSHRFCDKTSAKGMCKDIEIFWILQIFRPFLLIFFRLLVGIGQFAAWHKKK